MSIWLDCGYSKKKKKPMIYVFTLRTTLTTGVISYVNGKRIIFQWIYIIRKYYISNILFWYVPVWCPVGTDILMSDRSKSPLKWGKFSFVNGLVFDMTDHYRHFCQEEGRHRCFIHYRYSCEEEGRRRCFIEVTMYL